ncbi:MAG: C4-type zinc ribbon domain-containing protein [Verrucomicrobiota bacterium]
MNEVNMLEAIEKLLILQDRDRRILRTRNELADVEPQRKALQSRAASSQSSLDAAKLKQKQIETERKQLELEVEAKQQQIAKYSNQQLLTKKNEEYRALTHEIDMCKDAISKIEDKILDLMERADAVQKEVAGASAVAKELKGEADKAMTHLAEREANLKKQLAELEANRGELAAAVEEGALNRYERLFRHKGDNVVVGIDHGVCGGCHMKMPTQVIFSCRGQQEIVCCPNCGRILYYTAEMDMAVVD